jgi:hypothetical protein
MKKVKFNSRYVRFLTRHPSHSVLRKNNKGILVPELAVVRLGSTTKSNIPIQINSIEAVKTSSNKLLMKAAFESGEVESTEWWNNADSMRESLSNSELELGDDGELKHSILAKKVYGSRGRGMVKLDTREQLNNFLNGNTSGYYFERYYNYTREYRLHVTKEGCFYTCRKMLVEGTPDDRKWFRNDSNCTWFLEDNPDFAKPGNWEEIEENCVKALTSVGLDVGACDVRVRGKSKDGHHKFKIIEINSAPSFGEKTAEEYRKIIPKLVKSKM